MQCINWEIQSLYDSEYLVSEYKDVMCTHILIGLYPHFVVGLVMYRERAHQLYLLNLPNVFFLFISDEQVLRYWLGVFMSIVAAH